MWYPASACARRNPVSFGVCRNHGQPIKYLGNKRTNQNTKEIGIILCTDKNSIDGEYALGGLSNNLFASKYVLYIPNKEQLIAEVEKVLEKWHNSEEN